MSASEEFQQARYIPWIKKALLRSYLQTLMINHVNCYISKVDMHWCCWLRKFRTAFNQLDSVVTSRSLSTITNSTKRFRLWVRSLNSLHQMELIKRFHAYTDGILNSPRGVGVLTQYWNCASLTIGHVRPNKTDGDRLVSASCGVYRFSPTIQHQSRARNLI